VVVCTTLAGRVGDMAEPRAGMQAAHLREYAHSRLVYGTQYFGIVSPDKLSQLACVGLPRDVKQRCASRSYSGIREAFERVARLGKAAPSGHFCLRVYSWYVRGRIPRARLLLLRSPSTLAGLEQGEPSYRCMAPVVYTASPRRLALRAEESRFRDERAIGRY
jgi:hypothetical protein